MLVMRELSDLGVLPKSDREVITKEEKQEARKDANKLTDNQFKAATSFNRQINQLNKFGWASRVWVDGKGQLRALPTKATAPYPLPAGWKTVNQAPAAFAQATADFQQAHRLLAEGQLNAETWKQLVKEIDTIAAKAASEAFPSQRNQREDPLQDPPVLIKGEKQLLSKEEAIAYWKPLANRDDLVNTPAAAAQQSGVDARRPGESIHDWAARNKVSLPATFPKDKTPASQGGDPTIKQQNEQKLEMLRKKAEASGQRVVKVKDTSPTPSPPSPGSEADPNLTADVKPWFKRWQVLVPIISGVGLVSGLGAWLVLRRR